MVAFAASILDAAIHDVDDPVAPLREIEVVGHHQEAGATFAVHLPHQLEHAVGRRGVQVAGRLVCQHEVGVHGERPRNRYPLLLAAGHVGGQVARNLRQAHTLHQAAGAGGYVRAWETAVHQQRHHHVLLRRKGRNQVVGLEHEADRVSAQTGDRGVSQQPGILPFYEQLSRGGPVEQAVRDAKPASPDEEKAMRRAEAVGESHSKGEDPALRHAPPRKP